jgi:hypothetical protein
VERDGLDAPLTCISAPSTLSANNGKDEQGIVGRLGNDSGRVDWSVRGDRRRGPRKVVFVSWRHRERICLGGSLLQRAGESCGELPGNRAKVTTPRIDTVVRVARGLMLACLCVLAISSEARAQTNANANATANHGSVAVANAAGGQVSAANTGGVAISGSTVGTITSVSQEIEHATFTTVIESADYQQLEKYATEIGQIAVAQAAAIQTTLRANALKAEEIQAEQRKCFEALIHELAMASRQSSEALAGKIQELTVSITKTDVLIDVPLEIQCRARTAGHCARLSAKPAPIELSVKASVASALGTNTASVDEIVFRCEDPSFTEEPVTFRPADSKRPERWISVASFSGFEDRDRLDARLRFRARAACLNLKIVAYLVTASGQQFSSFNSLSVVAPPILFSIDDVSSWSERHSSTIPTKLDVTLGSWGAISPSLRVLSGSLAVAAGRRARETVSRLGGPKNVPAGVAEIAITSQPWDTWAYSALLAKDRLARDAFCVQIQKSIRADISESEPVPFSTLWLEDCDRVLKADLSKVFDSSVVPIGFHVEEVKQTVYADRTKDGVRAARFDAVAGGEDEGTNSLLFESAESWAPLVTFGVGAAAQPTSRQRGVTGEVSVSGVWGFADFAVERGVDSSGGEVRVEAFRELVARKFLPWLAFEPGLYVGGRDHEDYAGHRLALGYAQLLGIEFLSSYFYIDTQFGPRGWHETSRMSPGLQLVSTFSIGRGMPAAFGLAFRVSFATGIPVPANTF